MPPYQSEAVKPQRSLETVSVWSLFATLVVALFIFIPSPVSAPFATTKAFMLAAGALITLAIFILARLSRGNVIFPPFLLLGALWLPVIAYVLSATFSKTSFLNAFWGLGLEPDTLGFMLVIAVLGTMSALVLRRTEHYKAFVRASAWTFLVLVVVEFLVIIVGQIAPNLISPAFSIVGSMNDLATVLGLGVIGILISLRELELSDRTRRALTLGAVGAVILLAVANDTLVWILLAVVSLGFFVESVMQRGSRGTDIDLHDVALLDEEPMTSLNARRSLVLPLALLAVSLFFIIGGTLGNSLSNSLHIQQLNVRPSWQATFAVGNKAITASPIFGSGPGTFGAEWLKHRDASLNSTVFWNLDFSSGIGFIPTSLVTTGLLGLLAWIAFLGLFIVLGLRMLVRHAPQDAFIRYLALLSFLATIYLFTVAVFDLPSAFILVLAFVFAGLFASVARYSARGSQWGVVFSRSPRIGFVIVFILTILLLASVVAAYSLIGRYIAATQLARAGAAYSAGDLPAAERAVQSSISFAPSAVAYQIESGIAMARLGQIVADTTMPAAAAQKAFQEALSTGINAALTSTSLEPSNYQNWLMLGNLYAQAVPLKVSGAYESAKTAYGKAKALNPTNPQIPYVLAQLDIAHKDNRAAQENLKEAIALKQDYTTAIFLLSQLLVADGNVKDALDSALAAAYFTPNNPNILFQVGILYAAQSDYVNAVAALFAAITANPQFANARYFLAAVYAKQGDMKSALEQMQAIADMSADNATAVSSQLAALADGRNPFPANLLSVSSTPVKQ